VRVIAGSARGRKLAAPKGMGIRPTTDRMKENLFNILAPHIPGVRFLDIFCGTGAIGIEALSRGAQSAVFVDVNSTILIKNLVLTGFIEKATVLKNDYSTAMHKLYEKHLEFDIIYMDPPYYKGLIPQAAGLIRDMGLLSPDGILAAESAPDEDLPPLNDLCLYKVKRYSTSVFFFYQPQKGTLDNDSHFSRNI